MKILLYLSIIVFILQACQESAVQPPQLPALETIVEKRHRPLDSVTVFSAYNKAGRLVTETFSANRITYRIVTDVKELPSAGYEHHGFFRLLTYNSIGQLLVDKKLVLSGSNYTLASETDSLVYDADRLVKQELRDHTINSDGIYQFPFPLWITKRTVESDGQGRVTAELDSVFITHDIPAGLNYILPAPIKFLYINKTTYQYGSGGSVVKSAVSGADAQRNLKYSNGWSAYYASRPRHFLAGTTTNTYEYRPDGLLRRKIAVFNDGKTPTDYTSTFDYTYSAN